MEHLERTDPSAHARREHIPRTRTAGRRARAPTAPCSNAPTAATQQAREQLVQRFLPLARQLARRYQRGGEPLDDLIQVASLGLLKSIDRFDPSRETAFSSFAVPTILGELKRHFRDKGWSVRVPRDLQELAVKLEPAERGARARARPRRHARRDRQARRRHASSRCSRRARRPAPTARSRSTARATTTRTATASAPPSAIEDPGFGDAEDAATVERLMRVLSDREREVLRLRFEEDLTQAEIGDAHRRLPDARLAHHPPGDHPPARSRRGARGSTLRGMEHWDLRTLDVEPHQPKILHSARGEARSILINLPAGEELQEHQVHERAYVVVIDGEVELGGASGGAGLRRGVRSARAPRRHAPRATRGCCSCSRPGPGDGHPGARD